jgi:hypothetical protein
MSIRHMEDLKKIRPIIMFLMENSDDVLSELTTASVGGLHTCEPVECDKDRMLVDLMSTAMVIDATSTKSSGLGMLSTFSDEGSDASGGNSPFVRPGLLVSIPTLQSSTAISTALDGSISMDTDSNDDHRKPLAPSSSYSDGEWKLLHALVCNQMAKFLDLDEVETARFSAREAASGNYCSIMQAWAAKVATAASATSPMKTDISSVPVSPSSSIGSMNRANAMQKSSSRRTFRRKMVAD